MDNAHCYHFPSLFQNFLSPFYPYYRMGLEFSKYSEEINLSANRKMGISATEQLDSISKLSTLSPDQSREQSAVTKR